MNLPYQIPIPPMQPFALVLSHPSIAIGDQGLQIVWRGLGPFDVPILLRGDGIVIFDFPEAERFAGPPVPGYQPVGGEKIPREVTTASDLRTEIGYARLQYMNAWLASYMSAMAYVQKHGIITPPPVDPSGHLKAQIQDGCWIAFNNDISVVFGAASGTMIDLDVFDYAIRVMDAALQKFGANFTAPLSLFHQSSYQYRLHQFASSHLIAWSLSEQVLNAMWRNYQLEAADKAIASIPKERKKVLNGRDYTASIITQILSLSGKLSDDRMKKLDQARKDRNAFAHSLTPIDRKSAQNSMIVAADMLSDLLGIKLAPQLSNSYWI